MQVTLKTLQQQTFKIDIDPEETVRAEGSAGLGPRGARGVRRAWAGGGAAVRGVPASAWSRARRRARAGTTPGAPGKLGVRGPRAPGAG